MYDLSVILLSARLLLSDARSVAKAMYCLREPTSLPPTCVFSDNYFAVLYSRGAIRAIPREP